MILEEFRIYGVHFMESGGIYYPTAIPRHTHADIDNIRTLISNKLEMTVYLEFFLKRFGYNLLALKSSASLTMWDMSISVIKDALGILQSILLSH
jgi:hypothetical protein